MISDNVIRVIDILFTIWTVLFAFVGILYVGTGDGVTISPTAMFLLLNAVMCAIIVHLARKIRTQRSRKAFLLRYPSMRGHYP